MGLETTARTKRFITAALAAAALSVPGLAGSAGASPAQSDANGSQVTPTTELQVQAEAQHSIIPVPQASGTYEVQAGEPGSSEQYLVFVLIIGGLAAISLMVSRESKKKLAAQGRTKPDPAALYEDAEV